MKPRMGARAWLASKFKEDPTSVPKIVSEFCSYTTLTGLGRIVDSTTITRKAFWILLCLAAYAMCTWHCHTLFMQFFERPTVTVLTVKHAPKMRFPSVTICNLNMIRKSKLPHYIKEKLKQLEQLGEQTGDLENPDETTQVPLESMISPSEPTVTDMEQPFEEAEDSTLEPLVQPTNLTHPTSPTNPTEASPLGADNSTLWPLQPQTNKVKNASQVEQGLKIQGSREDLDVTPQRNATRRQRRNDHWMINDTVQAMADSEADDDEFDSSMDVDDTNSTNVDDYGGSEDDEFFTDYEDECDPNDPYSEEFCDDSEILGEEDQWETIETAILYELSRMEERDLTAAGHQFEDLVKSCTFQGYDCRNLSSFWTRHWDYRFGNCFTFNAGRDQHGGPKRILRTYKTGIKSGLKLNMFVEQSEYVPDLSEAAGLKVLITPQGHVPFPEDEGFFVTPGRSTAFGLRKSLIVRADPFNNGSCKEGQSLPGDNIYKKRFNASYTIQACTKHCLADHQVKVCKCAEMKFQVPNTTVCDVTDKIRMKCVHHVTRQFIEGKLGCEKRCPNPCREVMIKSTSSISQWPSNSFEDKLLTDHEQEEKFNASSAGNDEAVYMSRTNLLQVRVYFEQLNYEQVTEKLSYTWENLAADIGGETGLWIGVSVLTGAELLELIYLVICSALCGKKRQKEFPEEEMHLNSKETNI